MCLSLQEILETCAGSADCYISYDWNDRLKYAFIFHFFGLLWTNQFIVGLSSVVVAGAVANFYWSRGDSKRWVHVSCWERTISCAGSARPIDAQDLVTAGLSQQQRLYPAHRPCLSSRGAPPSAAAAGMPHGIQDVTMLLSVLQAAHLPCAEVSAQHNDLQPGQRGIWRLHHRHHPVCAGTWHVLAYIYVTQQSNVLPAVPGSALHAMSLSYSGEQLARP